MALWIGLLTPVSVTLALRVADLTSADKGAWLSLTIGAGALLAAVAGPVFGYLSDRTRARIGRRRPWLIGGMLVSVAGTVILVAAPNVVVLVVGWCVAALGFNAAQAAMFAVLPDHVPARHLGRVSGLLGLTIQAAVLVGTFLVQAVPARSPAALLLPTAIAVVFVGGFVVVLPDRPARAVSDVGRGLLTLLRAYRFSPRRHPDFAWAFVSRFLLMLGLSYLLTYQVYYLTDELGFSADDVARAVFGAMAVNATVTIIVSVAGGWLSDRVGRRKPFVVAAAVIAAAGLLIVGTAPTYTRFLVGIGVGAFGTGLYMAVDLALVAAVLPDPDDSAKDMSIFNIANAFPQSLAPSIAPLFLLAGSGDYTPVFVAGAVFMVCGAIAIKPIRAVL